MTPDEAFGRAVEQARWDKRMSQTAMANKMNLSQPTLSRKLKGQRPWTFAEMILAADALRIDVRDVLTSMWGPEIGTEMRPTADGLAGEPLTNQHEVGVGEVVDMFRWQSGNNKIRKAS